MGAYNPMTIQLINLNIPREVAIILKNTIFNNIYENELNEQFIKSGIKWKWNEIDFWNQVQLTHLI